MKRAHPKDTPIRAMLVSPRQFYLFAFGHDGVEQIEEARKRLSDLDLFPEIPVLTLNVLRCEMGWPAAGLQKRGRAC
ncbi:hypothetical protein [Acidovorax sp. NB1]|uniref:hypothetical protein n=1 Tax=Acidovorax sp. NB1 TaxID=1943571 RepID=UPI0010E53243|nr:hypothetical protein [Acidovorax sp. NB1]GDY37244.1 hypothetical protein ACINB_31360 [Acidovorax sp. NB1]